MNSFPIACTTMAPGARRPLACALLACGSVWAQPASPVAPAVGDAGENLPAVTVSASGLQLGVSEMTQPVSVLEGDALVRQREATLGETLEGQPGIAGSHFGAGASRPVIRGMDGARVRVLSDGAELHDASTISPDHAVVAEPLLATQIEVLRGPSALVHGAGAVGGVVNVLDGKMPTAVPSKGYEGSAEVRADSAAQGKAGAVAVTGGSGPFAVHVEAAGRDAGDYRVGSGWEGGRRVPGSFNGTRSASLGLSWVGESGYLGLAFTRQTARYGLPGHSHGFEGCHTHGNHLHCGTHDHGQGHGNHDHAEGHDGYDNHDHDHGAVPVVDLRSERIDLRGELRNPFAGVAALRLRGGFTDYVHDEVEGGEVATTFQNKAHDLRVELQHQPIAGLRGLLGVRTAERKFSAVGEEAYVQPTRTRSTGLFLLEEYRLGDWRIEGALRHDRQSARALESSVERSHRGSSASLGAMWRVAPGYALGASVTRASRAPTAEELYARGLHLATATYERGDAGLRSEISRNVDLTLRKTSGPTTFDVSVYRNRIRHYIHGRTLDELDGLKLLQYSQADATFTGIEGRVRQALTRQIGLTLWGDSVRARLDDGARLPRIAPARVGLKLDAQWRSWQGDIEWLQVARQSRVAQFETATPGYGLLNLGLAYHGGPGTATPWQVYLKVRNLTDRLAYSHVSFSKDAAPLAGRSVVLGMRVAF